MNKPNLRFNFGYLIEAVHGTSSNIEFDYPSMQLEDVTFSPLKGKFKATRTSEGILIQGKYETTIEVECVRCLEPFQFVVFSEADELFYYPPSLSPEGEYVVHEDGNADLGPLVRELTLLAMPMQPICQPDCKGLCHECGLNLNLGQCECEADNIDPRLRALKSLLD
jgi:uncharacterized protein